MNDKQKCEMMKEEKKKKIILKARSKLNATKIRLQSKNNK